MFAVAAFVVAWLSGLAAGVQPDAILVRSLIGAAGFWVLGRVLCGLATAFLGLPADSSSAGEIREEAGNPAENPGPSSPGKADA